MPATGVPTPDLKALVRIGTGHKLHPAIVTRWDTEPGKPWNRVTHSIHDITCGCPDTANGYATHRASIARLGDDAWDHRTCRTKES